jgi:hypothetical protein
VSASPAPAGAGEPDRDRRRRLRALDFGRSPEAAWFRGLLWHDPDAVHCKHCGRVLNIPNEGD